MQGNLVQWYQQIVKMGEEDIPMEIEGRITTPKEYMKSKGLI